MEQDRADGPGSTGDYQHPDPIIDAALTWFVALQDGTPDRGTLAAYRAWRQDDPRHAEAFDQLSGIAGMPELQAATLASLPPAEQRPEPRSASVLPIAARSGTRPASGRPGMPARRLWPGALVAAAVLAAVGLHLYPVLMLNWAADYRTAAGERREITLPDGSRLLLDSTTAVALDFEDGRRDVRLLQGEAFFSVATDPAHPFRVLGSYSTVQVTGTAFGVSSDGSRDAVVLEHGRVSVSGSAVPGHSLALAPGESVTASADGLSPVTRAEPEKALAWREGRYIFHDQPFGKVVDNLRRYYGGPILMLGGRVDQERVSGNYRLDDPVAALRSLAAIAGARIEILPGGVIILV